MEDKEQDMIRRRAYELWERQGDARGCAEEFWEQARRQIEEESRFAVDGGFSALEHRWAS
jgi:hypothetical protein